MFVSSTGLFSVYFSERFTHSGSGLDDVTGASALAHHTSCTSRSSTGKKKKKLQTSVEHGVVRARCTTQETHCSNDRSVYLRVGGGVVTRSDLHLNVYVFQPNSGRQHMLRKRRGAEQCLLLVLVT